MLNFYQKLNVKNLTIIILNFYFFFIKNGFLFLNNFKMKLVFNLKTVINFNFIIVVVIVLKNY